MMLGVAAAALTACATVTQSTKDAVFQRKYGSFTYAEVEAVKQTTQRSCGLAALVCVLRYWEKPASEADLVARHPLRKNAIGHTVEALRDIAASHGLAAFAVSFADRPAAHLSEQISKGRPVIVPVYCPQGRYFGDPLPVLETTDARVFRPFGIVPSATGKEFKHHYVVIVGEDRTRYLVMDPAYGLVTVGKESLLGWWKQESHAALLCAPAAAETPAPVPAPAS